MAEMTSTNKYTLHLDKTFDRIFKMFFGQFVCPCCNYPTLNGRMGYEICGLCDWEDDGQDDHDADQILGGPNQDYSLTEARDNFAKHFTMYRSTDTKQFNRFNKEKLNSIKKLYDQALTRTDEIEIKSILRQAAKLQDALRK